MPFPCRYVKCVRPARPGHYTCAIHDRYHKHPKKRPQPYRMPQGRSILARYRIFDCSPETRLMKFIAYRKGIPFTWHTDRGPPSRDHIEKAMAGSPPIDRMDVARWARTALLPGKAGPNGRSVRDRASHVHHLLHQRNQLERNATLAAPRDAVYRMALFDVTDQLIRTFCLEMYRQKNMWLPIE